MCRYDPEGEGRCQAGQLTCLGQAPDWDTADSACELCYNHFRSCMKKKPFVWCQGEVCQYDTDIDTGDNYNARTLLEASVDTDHYGK